MKPNPSDKRYDKLMAGLRKLQEDVETLRALTMKREQLTLHQRHARGGQFGAYVKVNGLIYALIQEHGIDPTR